MKQIPLGDEITAAATTLDALIEHENLPADTGFTLVRLSQAMQSWAERLPSAQDEIRVRAIADPTTQPVTNRLSRMALGMQGLIGMADGAVPREFLMALRAHCLQLDECQDAVEAMESRLSAPRSRELPPNVVPLRRPNFWPAGRGGNAA